jgi:hypothetical protein
VEKIKSITELEDAIRLLEIKQSIEGMLLKDEIKNTAEKFKPINLIKNALNELTSPSFKENLIDTTISIAAGYISKKIIIGQTHNPIKQVFGTLFQMGVTSFVSTKTDGIKSTIINLISKVLNKKNTLS